MALKTKTYGWCSSQTNFHFTHQFHSNHSEWSGVVWARLHAPNEQVDLKPVEITHVENKARRINNPKWWNQLLDYTQIFFLQPWRNNKKQIYPQALSNQKTRQKVWNNFFQIFEQRSHQTVIPKRRKANEMSPPITSVFCQKARRHVWYVVCKARREISRQSTVIFSGLKDWSTGSLLTRNCGTSSRQEGEKQEKSYWSESLLNTNYYMLLYRGKRLEVKQKKVIENSQSSRGTGNHLLYL